MKKILNIKEPDITALEKKEVLNCLKFSNFYLRTISKKN